MKTTKYDWHMYSDDGLRQYINFLNKHDIKITPERKKELLDDIKQEQLERSRNNSK